jgi:hypothetical protein
MYTNISGQKNNAPDRDSLEHLYFLHSFATAYPIIKYGTKNKIPLTAM